MEFGLYLAEELFHVADNGSQRCHIGAGSLSRVDDVDSRHDDEFGAE